MTSLIDPKQYIISRKRKKYKFALFANSPLCFEFEEWKQRRVEVVEIGAGDGLFSVELAIRYPEKNFLALDVKADRLQKGAYEAEERGLTNIKFVRARADQLAEVVDEQSLEKIWLTFPDPFPKKRSAGRRMTHKSYLYTYTKLLKTSGQICLKHDDRGFFLWSLEQLVACGWRISELSFDLQDSELSDDYKQLTTYETRWIAEGKTTSFAAAAPPKI